ncbi:MAG: hypothetical protein ACHP9T_15855, partial [Caulobacterales bacterium]
MPCRRGRRRRAAISRPRPVVHHVHRVRHVVGAPVRKAPRVVVASRPRALNLAESSRDQQTIPVFVPRPVSCDDQPVIALQSPPPARPVAPAQRLLDALAGPPPVGGKSTPVSGPVGGPMLVMAPVGGPATASS